jgi:sulfur carrier protein
VFVILNGTRIPLTEPQTLAALLVSLSPPPPFAVAHNEEVVPRGRYEAHFVSPGDRIEIVHPSAGG